MSRQLSKSSRARASGSGGGFASKGAVPISRARFSTSSKPKWGAGSEGVWDTVWAISVSAAAGPAATWASPAAMPATMARRSKDTMRGSGWGTGEGPDPGKVSGGAPPRLGCPGPRRDPPRPR